MVPGSVYETGPAGLDSWFVAMQKEIAQCVRWLIAAFANAAILIAIFQAMPEWTVGPLNETAVDLLLFLLWLPLPLRAAWHWEAAHAYAIEWDALEQHGLEWHFENDGWYRIIFRRADGSYNFDLRTRNQRAQAEIKAVRDRGPQIIEAARKIQIIVFKACVFFALTYFAFSFAIEQIDQPWLLAWNFPLIFTAWYLGTTLSPPLSNRVRLTIERRAYERGKQFIPNPRVFDPAHKALTLETVKEQATLGDAAFVDPDDASASLRS
jgi:hypothetical protein